jgi:hypothetical protein
MAYPAAEVCTELQVGGQVLWSGPLATEISVDGAPIRIAGEWDQLCWESNKDVDYVELQGRFGADVKVQRQLLLCKEDRLLFIADALLGRRPVAWEHRLEFPLAGPTRFAPEPKTNEGFLVQKGKRFRVFPLALPEWRLGNASGELSSNGDRLVQCFSARGQNTFVPLVIDLVPNRARLDVTWRHLTVAESRRNVRRDEAVSFRLQVGRRQWLVYRSLTPPANRTTLGQNYATEFVFAKFLSDGTTDPLIEIE